MAHGGKGPANGPMRGAGPRPTVVGHGGKSFARATTVEWYRRGAVGDGGCRAYIRGNDSRRPSRRKPPPPRLAPGNLLSSLFY
jgi:hypothetical protein